MNLKLSLKKIWCKKPEVFDIKAILVIRKMKVLKRTDIWEYNVCLIKKNSYYYRNFLNI